MPFNGFRLVPIVTCCLVAVVGPRLRADDVDDLVTAAMARQKIPGCAFIVLREGKIVKAAAHGLADIKEGRAVATDTVFRLQSVSKQFTAAGILLLADNGKLGLDDPILKYLAGCPPAWEKITVRHLLTQTSGLRDFINEPTMALDRETTDEQLFAAVAASPLKFAPGDAWAYSNTNYLLLGIIITKVSGQWYGDFLSERIFKKLGMTQTFVPRDHAALLSGARGYFLKNGQLQPGVILPVSIANAASGGMSSTVLDLAKWDAALESETLLPRASLDQMWTPVKLNSGATHPYGFGWDLGEIAGHRRVSHSGRFTGFSTHIDRFVDDRLTVIVLTNLFDATPGRITRDIAGHYIPALAVVKYVPIPDTEPAVTKRVTDVLRRCAEGKLRNEDFTPEVWSYLAPYLDQLSKDMKRFGPLETLALVERSDRDGGRSYRYEVRFKRTTVRYHFVFTPEDRISQMMPERTDQ